MTTPIVDFVRRYAESGAVRFHMPGHKGTSYLGCEPWDITEIAGADVLYAPEGILAESEANATELFGSGHTFYSAEGSTLCIKAMLALVCQGKGEQPLILAARNAHKALIYAAALLDLRIRWLEGSDRDHLCRCEITPDEVRSALADMREPPAAVYLTSPDYLGNLSDVRAVAEVCREAGIPLLVDNAHGAYLKFLNPSLHPLDLGATMCCDSAHKTLPALTGGAYLHLAKGSPYREEQVRSMLSLFASTSPSYLILQSLDFCNLYLEKRYSLRLGAVIQALRDTAEELASMGIPARVTEPLKLLITPKPIGYTGTDLADALREGGIESEFSDEEVLVLMASADNGTADFDRLLSLMSKLPHRDPIPQKETVIPPRAVRVSDRIRAAMLAPQEIVPTAQAAGRICATPTVSCPPAIPIAVSGDVITEEDVALFLRYGIQTVSVVK